MADPDTLEAIRRHIVKGQYTEAADICVPLLRENPQDGPVIFLYGKLALDMGRAEDAIIILRKLLALAPNHKGAHEDLAYAYQLAGDYTNARHHAQHALTLDSNLVNPRMVLGSISMSEGKDEEALGHIEHARKLSSGNVGVEKLYIDSLFNLGRFDEARDLLKALIATHPSDCFLYKQLADTHRFTDGDPELALVRSLASPDGPINQDSAPAEKAFAHFALFKVESDLENTDIGFDHLLKAKGIRCEMQPPYDGEDVLKRQQTMQEIFSADFFNTPGAGGCDSTAPIFIVGMPRSGTSLLERILASHPDVAAGGELPTVGRLLEEACARFGANQYDIAALGTMGQDAWQQLGEKYLYIARQRVGDAIMFTDKRPSNAFQVGFIRAMLPRATIIHLSRHPVATCLSIFEQDFSHISYANDLASLGQHYVAYRRAMDYWHKLFPDSLVSINYEALVGDTPSVLASLGQQMNLDFDKSDIAASQQSGEILTASRWQARQPIHTDSVERWKLLEHQLQPLLDALAPVWPGVKTTS